jgi:hypothetical protein
MQAGVGAAAAPVAATADMVIAKNTQQVPLSAPILIVISSFSPPARMDGALRETDYPVETVCSKA